LMKKNGGFTLIELLVVIAIIGILASIVLVTFPGATKKAKDSRVVSAIAQIRTIMTYVDANEGSYSSLDDSQSPCTSIDDLTALCNEVSSNNLSGSNPTFQADADEACIYSDLNAKASGGTAGYWYCADSTGVAGYTETDPSSTGNCDGTTFVCPSDISS